MRIISGKFKGIALHGPKDRKIRPLKDMVRESVFNLLSHSNKISVQLKKSNVLDLYSGTGSFGLECISRESGEVVFVEKENEAIKILEKNIKKLKVQDITKIFCDNVFNVIEKKDKASFQRFAEMKFNLIFCDPPFKDTNINDLIDLIIKKDLLKNNGIIIIHTHKNTNEKLNFHFKILDKRIYGVSKIIFGKIL